MDRQINTLDLQVRHSSRLCKERIPYTIVCFDKERYWHLNMKNGTGKKFLTHSNTYD
jgi:hypothetical protein